jgi:hypothetical protein
MQLATVAVASELYIPPPEGASFAVNVQLVIVGDADLSLNIPPPVEIAELAANAQLVIVGDEEKTFSIPPPDAVGYGRGRSVIIHSAAAVLRRCRCVGVSGGNGKPVDARIIRAGDHVAAVFGVVSARGVVLIEIA